MPVILPSYGERASEVLIAQLTKNYKATVMLSDVNKFNVNVLIVFIRNLNLFVLDNSSLFA
jgi:hypothetical protein